MTKKIIGMGNAVLDILTKVENNFIDENNLSKGTMAIVSKDESQEILEKIEMIKTDSGGSVANTISTLSLLGLDARFCGKVSLLRSLIKKRNAFLGAQQEDSSSSHQFQALPLRG